MFPLPAPAHGIIGHRGALDCAPENTLAGFRAAHIIGLNWIEFDIQLTLEEQWVIFHDADLKRLVGSPQKVRELTSSALQAVYLPGDYTIPLLSEALPILWGLGLHLNLELKVSETDNVAALRSLEPIIECWPKEAPLPFFSSFNHALLLALQQRFPHLPLGFLATAPSDALIALVKRHQPATLNLCWEDVTPEQVAAYAAEGLRVLLYTVNDRNTGKRFLEAGAWAIFTDCPQDFIPQS